ncbi:fatty acid desaturase [Polynucleobacter sp. MWH-Svant-W18]|nr:fatty acid desaturase [Polynucleobacter sp. MWH-Svant-W18]
MSTHLNSALSEPSLTNPLPPEAPLPHRKIIRSWLIPMAQGETGRAIMLLIVDACLWLACIAGTVFVENLLLKIIFGLVAGFVTGRIFILGHDACHQSFTPNRELNKVLGRIAFLPSLTPYSLWDVGHNVVHHGQTNLKGFDFVWAPLSKAEYDALPAWRKALERLYRSGWGPVFYYLIEIWWRREYFPNAKNKPGDRPIFLKDNLLVTAFAIVWIGCLIAGAIATGQSVWLGLITGFAVPFLFWNGMIGFVVYVHHTHPSVSWYDKKSEWLRAQPFVSTTVHLTFNWIWGSLMHHIMEHTAHHVDMSVPLYRLQEAQNTLETILPERIFVQKFSWDWYFDTARKCKLYDFENKAWLDFDGNKTAESVKVVLSPAPAGQNG